MPTIDEMARDAGFLKAGEINTCSAGRKEGKVFGMDIVSNPLMPEGYVAIRNEHGAWVLGPKGSWYVPFNPPRQLRRSV